MSVYEKFLDNYKNKLCESKSKKVSVRKLTRVNESDAYEKGYLDESCGKRKPKKPFLRKSLKESAKDRFVKKVFGRSKLSESRTLKRTRKVKVPMNEATVNYLLRFTADGIKAGSYRYKKRYRQY